MELIRRNGTHLDAPYHFASTMNHGERAITIDEVPLEWCFQPGVRLDFRHFPEGYVVTANDVECELKRIGYELKPLEIVVINTRAGTRYGQNDYVNFGCGMGSGKSLSLRSSPPTPMAPLHISSISMIEASWSGHTMLLQTGTATASCEAKMARSQGLISPRGSARMLTGLTRGAISWGGMPE